MKIFTAFMLLCVSAACYGQQKERHWAVPDHYKTQFAGNIGFISAGAGHLHAKDKMETDLFLGYLPKSVGGDHIFSLSSKTTFFPWTLQRSDNIMIRPLSLGAYLTYSFGSQFDTLLPNEYPDGYYWWATSLRFGMYAGGTVGKRFEGKVLSAVHAYYELSTYDLKFISYVQNSDALSIPDIFSLALGLKFEFAY